MSRIPGAGVVLAVLVLVMLFARQNGGERVTLDLGFVLLQRVLLRIADLVNPAPARADRAEYHQAIARAAR